MGPPGRDGLAGPRGEPVSHFPSFLCRLASGSYVPKQSGSWVISPCRFFPPFVLFAVSHQGKQGEPGPSGKAGLPGTPVSLTPTPLFFSWIWSQKSDVKSLSDDLSKCMRKKIPLSCNHSMVPTT